MSLFWFFIQKKNNKWNASGFPYKVSLGKLVSAAIKPGHLCQSRASSGWQLARWLHFQPLTLELMALSLEIQFVALGRDPKSPIAGPLSVRTPWMVSDLTRIGHCLLLCPPPMLEAGGNAVSSREELCGVSRVLISQAKNLSVERQKNLIKNTRVPTVQFVASYLRNKLFKRLQLAVIAMVDLKKRG